MTIFLTSFSSARLVSNYHQWLFFFRCNGLLPLWGPGVAESAFANSMARHNAFLMEATRHRDVGYTSTLHDLKLLLLRSHKNTNMFI